MLTLTNVVLGMMEHLAEFGFFQPTIILEGTKKKVTVAYPVLPGGGADEASMRRHGRSLALQDVIGDLQQLHVIVETRKSGNPNADPKADPKLIEYIYIFQHDEVHNIRDYAQYEKIRDEKGKIVDLKAIKSPGEPYTELVFDPLIDVFLQSFKEGRAKRGSSKTH